ncbi:host-range protein [Murmansk poxvirus]|uniref:Host-range protein n=1 Tax=Murmansk poxvirus TaxID=2025359 RepID=A0A223FN29_9POXV|nr:host-range protein [Murmansk poxvirus]AST09388.1 host-range protein [Murmansk poxvirus]
MGIQHEFDIIIDRCIGLRNLQLYKGDNYGCMLKITSNDYKKMRFRFIIRPDWSEVEEVKELIVTSNNYPVKLNKVEQTLHHVIYDADICLYKKVTNISIYSEKSTELFRDKYPHISLNLNNNDFRIKKENCAYPDIEYPLIPYRDYET